MNTADAIKYAGSAIALSRILGVTSGAISQWGDVVPDAKQLLLERITIGALRADPGCLDRVIGLHKVPPAPASIAAAATN